MGKEAWDSLQKRYTRTYDVGPVLENPTRFNKTRNTSRLPFSGRHH